MNDNRSALAMIFPGQGSQSVGMLAALAADQAVVTDTFEEASQVLGLDLWDLVQQGPDTRLGATRNTQPAMLAAGVAVWRVWKLTGGGTPEILAGHSLGEYTALVAAGAIAFTDAVALVAERGRLMQQAVPEGIGAMAAILGLEDSVVSEICIEAAEGAVVEAANFNAPGQVVVAGHCEAVSRAIELARGRGAKRALLLPVSVPSHCALMRDAAAALRARLESVDIQAPRIPVLHNVDVSDHPTAAAIREALTRQMYRPVRWVETIRALRDRGAHRLIECGPGKVLSGLNRRIDRDLRSLPVFDPATLSKALEA